jgi:hypothetical protein
MNAPGGTRIRAGLEWVQSIDASPDYTLKRLSRGAVFGKLSSPAALQSCELKSRDAVEIGGTQEC